MASTGLLLTSSSTRQIHAFNSKARAGVLRCCHRRPFTSRCIQRNAEDASEGTGNKVCHKFAQSRDMPVQSFVMHALTHRLAQAGSTQLSLQRREALLSTASLTAALFLSDLGSLPAAAADIKTVRLHDQQDTCHQQYHTQRLGTLTAHISGRLTLACT